MADEKVNVVIKFDAKTRQLDAAIAKMALLNKYEKRFASGQQLERFASRSGDAAKKMSSKWKMSFDLIDASVKMTGKFLTGFLKTAIKGVIGQMGLFGAAMIGVHATFVAGQLIMKAYRGAMQLVAGGAAAATMAIAAFSAALREQQAVMFAYRGKGAKEFGSGMNQTRMAMRNLQADASLATLGVEALNKAYGTMSKSMNVAQINASTATIRALMDFGSAGQDPAKGLEQVALVIASLSDKKKNISDVITEAKKLGPEMEAALKKANVKTKAEFEKLLMSGQLAEKGGVVGQFNNINNTLIGQLKSYMTRLRTEFADFGDQFLEPLKVAFDDIFNIIRRDLSRIQATIAQSVGAQGIVDGLVGAFEKTSNFMVKLMREYLPRAIGLFGRIGDWMREFKRDWNIVLERLRPLISGAKVLYNALSPIWEAIKDGLNQIFNFNNQLLDNEARFKEFGTNIASIITTISNALANMRQIFETISPFINDVLKGFGDVFRQVSSFLTGGTGKSFMMALQPLIAMQVFGSKMAATRGRMAPQINPFSKAVTIQAQTATIVAAGMGGPVGAVAGGVLGAPRGYVSSGLGTIPQPGSIAPPALSSGGAYAFPDLSSSGGFSSNKGVAEAFSYGKQFARKDAASTPDAFKGKLSSGSAPSGARTAEIAAAMKTMSVSGFRDLKNLPLSGLGANLEAARQLGESKFGPGMSDQAKALRAKIDKAQFLLGLAGPSRAGVIGRALLEPVTGGIGGTLAGGAPTNDQYSEITGAPIQTSMRERLDTAKSNKEFRRRILRQKRSAQLQLAATRGVRGMQKGYGFFRGIGAFLGGPAYDPYANEGKGGYLDIGAVRRQNRERRDTRMALQNTFIGRTAARIGYIRDEARAARGEGNRFGRFFTKGMGSVGAKFGISSGLGALSQYAPEEMRGSMALGALASQFDPRLGLAVAGVGGALTARSAGKGAVSGAIGGATVGAYFGGVGAIIGMGIGGLVGAIRGSINKAKVQLDEAKRAGQEVLGSFFATLAKAGMTQFVRNQEIIDSGDLTGLSKFGAFENVAASVRDQAKLLQNDFGMPMGPVNPNAGKGKLPANYYTDTRVRKKYDSDPRNTPNKRRIAQLYRDQAKYGLTITLDQMREFLVNEQTAAAGFNEVVGGGRGMAGLSGEFGQINILSTAADQTTARMNTLRMMFNKTGPEIENMAQAVGLDLLDPLIKFEDVVKKLGGSLRLTTAQMKQMATDAFLGGANPFIKRRKQADAELAIDQSTRGLFDVLSNAGTSKTDRAAAIDSYMETYYTQALALTGGDPVKALMMTNSAFGSGATGGIFAPGEIFSGFGSEITARIPQGSLGGLQKEVGAPYAQDLFARITEAGFSADLTSVKAGIGNLSGTQFEALVKGLENNTLKSFSDFTDPAELQKYLTSLGFSTLRLELGEKGLDAVPDLRDKMVKLGENVRLLDLTMAQLNQVIGDPFTKLEMPDWWRNGLVAEAKNGTFRLVPPEDTEDTSTPRGGAIGDTTSSKLQQTMSRHAALNSQVPGNRSITSAWRDHNLGSINSDHVTGRAYDLVGQNLGKYQTLVREGGGFAEFHGNFSKRHLHVVPGAGAMGDMSSPAGKVSTTSAAGATINNNYNISINGANMSLEAIADVVIDRIDKRNRSYGERS